MEGISGNRSHHWQFLLDGLTSQSVWICCISSETELSKPHRWCTITDSNLFCFLVVHLLTFMPWKRFKSKKEVMIKGWRLNEDKSPLLVTWSSLQCVFTPNSNPQSRQTGIIYFSWVGGSMRTFIQKQKSGASKSARKSYRSICLITISYRQIQTPLHLSWSMPVSATWRNQSSKWAKRWFQWCVLSELLIVSV